MFKFLLAIVCMHYLPEKSLVCQEGYPVRKQTIKTPLVSGHIEKRGWFFLLVCNGSHGKTVFCCCLTLFGVWTVLVRLYQTAVVTKRIPKRDEVLMSIDGSPVLNSFVLPVDDSQVCDPLPWSDLTTLSLFLTCCCRMSPPCFLA